MFVVVSQTHKLSINYVLQILGLVTCAFCLASSLAFLLSRYVLDVPNRNSMSLALVPPEGLPEAEVLLIPNLNESESKVQSSLPMVVPVPQSRATQQVKPEKPNAPIPTSPPKVPPPMKQARAHAKPRPSRATRRSTQFKPLIAKKRVSSPAKPHNVSTLAPKSRPPLHPDFETLEQSLGVAL